MYYRPSSSKSLIVSDHSSDSSLGNRLGGGGAATSAGIQFQAQVGALLSAYMLSDQCIDARIDVGNGSVEWIRFETEAPVDDILVATSDDGFIAIQAKTTVSRSRDPSSAFAKTIAQFTKYWIDCQRGDGSAGWNRPLDASRDRLVLAVGSQASAAIKVDLPTALALKASPGQPQLTQAQQVVFDDFEFCIRTAWANSTAEPFSDAAVLEIARFVRVAVFDFAGTDAALVRTVLHGAAGASIDAGALFSGIEQFCYDLMKQRGGTDLDTLRAALRSAGFDLGDRPRYRADIEALRAYSSATASDLRRYEVVEASPGNQVSIVRDCQQGVFEAAAAGNLLIIGEPGSGKSGVVSALAERLRAELHDVVELAVDSLAVDTSDGLARALGLEHDLVEVLKAWDGEKSGWLVIDALDATRGGQGEGVFRALIKRVIEMNDRWRVVASIRSFDLRMGQQFRALFKGKPPVAALADRGFGDVRHVSVPNWSGNELRQLMAREPRLASVLDAAPQKFRELAVVPFNTRLICDLLAADVLGENLERVSSQVQLLQLFWRERIECYGTSGRAVIIRAVQSMLESGSLQAPFDKTAADSGDQVDKLQKGGILVPINGGRSFQFRHHILFDFAAAAVYLDPNGIVNGSQRFPKDDGRGLMLAPALLFVLHELWDQSVDRDRFWSAVAKLITDRAGDPVLRSSASRAGAEFPVDVDDTAWLVQEVGRNNPLLPDVLNHVGGALAVRIDDHSSTPLQPWIALASGIGAYVGRVTGAVRFLVAQLLPRAKSQEERAGLGSAARALLAYAFENGNAQWLVASAIDLVLDTYSTNSDASRTLLARIFEAEQLELHSWEYVPLLGRKIGSIADCDPDFASYIYNRTYEIGVTDERKTRIGNSQILSMTSTARQDYDMARYSLAQYFPTFLQHHSSAAVDGLVAAVDGFFAREHPRTEPVREFELTVNNQKYRLEEDLSCVWGHDPERVYGYDADFLVVKFVEHLRAATEQVAIEIARDVILRCSKAIFWARLFMVAAERRDKLLDLMWPFAVLEPMLVLPDTRKDAIDVVTGAWDRRTAEERIDLEEGAFTFDFSGYQDEDGARRAFVERLFASIGADRLLTDRAREMIAREIDESEGKNERLMHFSTSWERADPYQWIQGLDRSLPANADLMAALESTQDLLALAPGKTPANDVTLDAALKSLEALDVRASAHGVHAVLRLQAEGTIGQGCSQILTMKLLGGKAEAPNLEPTVNRLIDLIMLAANSASPEVQEETEQRFEESAAWGSPAARLEAAEAILDLCLQAPERYRELAPVIDRLLADPHPAVRMHAALMLIRIWDLDRHGFWSRLETRLQKETNRSVLVHLTSDLVERLLHAEPQRCLTLLRQLIDRVQADGPRAKDLRAHIAGQITVLWVRHSLEEARESLERYVSSPTVHSSELLHVLMALRGAYVIGLNADSPLDASVRQRAFSLTLDIVSAANLVLGELIGKKSASEQEAATVRDLAQVVDSACNQLYFTVDKVIDGTDIARNLAPQEVLQFVREAQPVLEQIGEYATPHTVYYLLQLVEKVLDYAPQTALDVTSHALLNGGARTGYQFDPLGVDHFVSLVGRLLADHKDIFQAPTSRTALIACLECFLDAGWPAARRLLYRLPELIQ